MAEALGAGPAGSLGMADHMMRPAMASMSTAQAKATPSGIIGPPESVVMTAANTNTRCS